MYNGRELIIYLTRNYEKSVIMYVKMYSHVAASSGRKYLLFTIKS